MPNTRSALRRAFVFLGSVHFTLVLLIGGMAVMAFGTIVDSTSGLEVARSSVYETLWFDLYLALIGVNLALAVVNRIPVKRHQWSFVLTHFSIVLLLGGAWISRTYVVEGLVPILEGGREGHLLLRRSEVALAWMAGGEEQRVVLPTPDTVFLSGHVLQEEVPGQVGVKVLEYEPHALATIHPVVDRLVPAARPETAVTPCDPGNEHAIPCIRLEVSREGNTSSFWIPRGGLQAVMLDGSPMKLAFRQSSRQLPFTIELSEFTVGHHPGGNRPATFESHVVLRDDSGRIPAVSAVVAMNRPLDYMGFRLFQSGYVLGEGGSPDKAVLAVSRDPGVPVIYSAFVLLIVGIGSYLLTGLLPRKTDRTPDHHGSTEAGRIDLPGPSAPHPDSPNQRPSRQSVSRALSTALLVGASLLVGDSPRAEPGQARSEIDVRATEGWAVQSEGRVKPLGTHAREIVLAITGRSESDGLDALHVFWGYVFDGDHFGRRDHIRIDSKILKEEIGLDPEQRRFSYATLVQSAKLRAIVNEAETRKAAEEELSPLQEGAIAAAVKLKLVDDVFVGVALRIVPGQTIGEAWLTPEDLRSSSKVRHVRILQGMGALATAYRAGDAATFDREAAAMVDHLRSISPAVYPDSTVLGKELFYNHLNAFGKSWMIYLASFLAILLAGLGGGRVGRWIGVSLLGIGLAFHTIGIALRWMIAGRAPVSDMYESLVFMAWGVAVIGLALEVAYQKGYFALVAGFMGTLVLAMAETLPIDSTINPLVPVLANTSWLSVHVMTIMLSYSAFALAMAMGHVVMAVQIFRPGKNELLRSLSLLLYRILQVGLLFLAAGIIFGAVWANRSWGRTWGWDPKETWSLITFFAYLGLVHARFAGWLHHFGTAAWSILCFLCVLMTYYGVNFILGTGLHSYGFGSGGMLYVGIYLAAEMAIIVLATKRYYTARPPRILPARTGDATAP